MYIAMIKRRGYNTAANGFPGITVDVDLSGLYSGRENLYVINSTGFYKADSDFSKALEPLREMADKYGSLLNFEVGKNNLNYFYDEFLPSMAKYLNINEEDSGAIHDNMSASPEYEFYLDQKDGQVTCKAKAIYESGEHSISPGKPSMLGVRAGEAYVTFFLSNWFEGYNQEKETFYLDAKEDGIFDFLKNGVDGLMKIGQVNVTEAFKNLKVKRKANISVGVKIESGLLDLTIESNEIDKSELLDILKNYKEKKKYYRLKNGEYLDLQDESIAALSDITTGMGIKDSDLTKDSHSIPIYRSLYLDKYLEREGVTSNRDKHYKNLVKDFKTIDDSDFEEPESLQKILRHYQKKGHKWLRTIENYKFGGILADDMGLGKTLQIISVLLAYKENTLEEDRLPSLIVSPASLVYNWQDEVAKFAPQVSVGVVAGTKNERSLMVEEYNKYDILVTSYDLLKRDIDFYSDKKFQYQIIDEGQFIKNPKTAVAKAVKSIDSVTKFALTGTPIENRLSELWSIFDYLMPGFLYSYTEFKKKFETPIVKNDDKDMLELLRKMVMPFILRRLKKEVLTELPDKIEKIRIESFDDEQRKIYDAHVLQMKNQINSGENDINNQKIAILAMLTKLRQVCCDPGLLYEDYSGLSAKREGCIDLIQSAIDGEHKILLFSQFTSMIEILKKDFDRLGISYYTITGETKKEKRIELVNKFNNDNTNVFLISLKAGGTGLNLTGADVVIHYDPWWNVAVQNQATDRAHRIGQEKVVTEYKLVMKNTIEEKIIDLQNKKKELADQVISGENGGIAGMSKDDILELLEI